MMVDVKKADTDRIKPKEEPSKVVICFTFIILPVIMLHKIPEMPECSYVLNTSVLVYIRRNTREAKKQRVNYLNYSLK
jgi:hypothetical protein